MHGGARHALDRRAADEADAVLGEGALDQRGGAPRRARRPDASAWSQTVIDAAGSWRSRAASAKATSLPPAPAPDHDDAPAGCGERRGEGASMAASARLDRLQARPSAPRRPRGARRRLRADVERQQVVGVTRPVGELDSRRCAASTATARPATNVAAGALGERRDVDLRLAQRVLSGDDAGDHAGVGRVAVGRVTETAQARLRARGERREHEDVAVAAADEDELRAHGHDREDSPP